MKGCGYVRGMTRFYYFLGVGCTSVSEKYFRENFNSERGSGVFEWDPGIWPDLDVSLQPS